MVSGTWSEVDSHLNRAIFSVNVYSPGHASRPGESHDNCLRLHRFPCNKDCRARRLPRNDTDSHSAGHASPVIARERSDRSNLYDKNILY